MTCLKSDIATFEKCVDCLKKGKIVILPTDTVYGFSGIVDSVSNTDSVIRSIKGRAETKPLIQLISSPEDLTLFTNDIIPEKLLQKWPGALTIIVKNKNTLKGETTAFRCPGDKWLRSIIKEVASPIYSTSVNRSGAPVLDAVAEIEKEFHKEVDLIVDDGDKKNALPSTIVKIENGKISILRQGSVII